MAPFHGISKAEGQVIQVTTGKAVGEEVFIEACVWELCPEEMVRSCHCPWTHICLTL